jgi:hypothetical protein
MSHGPNENLTRRELLRLSAVGVAGAGANLLFPQWSLAAHDQNEKAAPSLENLPSRSTNLYSELLKTWCDGLLARQVPPIHDPALRGGLLCPACALIHGRCGDAVYPLLRIARTTGESKYIQAAILVHEWSERHVSRPDGSWVNDVTLSSWKGITVFHAIALAEALHHHGSLLDASTRRQWTDRLALAAKFLDRFITIETGNINYPVTSTFCFAACSQALEEPRYLDRARQLAHTVLEYFTPNGFLFGEGHPLKGVTAKGCRPVDLGYNVEESLPSLALYALVANDKIVLDQVVASLRTHIEFMLPDGAWDNSWGTRNYKWSWWGSRTSDGCHPAYVLLAEHEPRFREAAWRNLELMASCTHDGLLYGGPHYFVHGDLPCVHHTFTHAKALATVLDRGGTDVQTQERLVLPREEAYGLRSYPEIATQLVAIGDWRATVTEYDWEYVEHVQAGGAGRGGGHVTGGALSVLFHRVLGPLLTASMTHYQIIEISNQQMHGDYPHMELTPRLEAVDGGQVYSSGCDLHGAAEITRTAGQITFDVHGRLLPPTNPHAAGGIMLRLGYKFTTESVEISATPVAAESESLHLIIPVISNHDEVVERIDPKTIRISKAKGNLIIRTNARDGFDNRSAERTFNLVPGFECLPLTVKPQREQWVSVQFSVEASSKSSPKAADSA